VDIVARLLEVGQNEETNEIYISHPAFKPDKQGKEKIVISPRHARYLANLLVEYATNAENEAFRVQDRSTPPAPQGHSV